MVIRRFVAVSVLAVLCLLTGQTTMQAADKTPARVVFSEGFENGGQMRFWASNGPYKVNYAGPSEEMAASGKRSFKIDITWQDCKYNYWQSAALLIPYYGEPKVTGKLRVVRGDAALGYSWADPVAETGGNVVRGEKVRTLSDGWTEWSCSASGLPEDGKHILAVALYLEPDRDGRTVVYVDDLKIEAALGPNYEKEAHSTIARIVGKRQAEVRKAAEALRARFLALTKRMDAKSAELAAPVSPLLVECWRQLQDYIRRTRSELEAKLTQLQATPSRPTLDQAQSLLLALEKAHSSAESFVDCVKRQPTLPYPIWIVEPIRDEKILPTQMPFLDRLGTRLSVSACRGEYEPASFAVYAPKGLRHFSAEASDAKCGDHTIPASAIDLRVVKCWWQAGVTIDDLRHPTLTPELLLKDADFVRVDDAKKSNALRDPQAPRDGEELKPLAIPAGATQQFWVTVHVPQDAHPGTYHGTIRLCAADAPPVNMALEIEVLPFALEPPALQYSIYYRGCLTADGKGSITSEAKSPEQYLAEMRDLKAHGVEYPTCYQGFDDLVDRAIAIRKEAQIVLDPFYSLGMSTGAPRTPAALAALKAQTQAAVARAARHGIKQLYVYGIDEASGDALQVERAAFQAVHEAGAKVFVACYADAAHLVGDLLDLAVHAGALLPSQAKKWHAYGHRIFSYANPQVGMEVPETYRRNYGLALWKAGYDGAMNYAYQHGFSNVWDDFDGGSYRDHVFAYPTVDGVIDTIQWEGFREGVDDVRYLSTLLKAIEQAKSSPAKKALVEQAEQWVRDMDVQEDLDALRKQMIRRIVELAP